MAARDSLAAMSFCALAVLRCRAALCGFAFPRRFAAPARVLAATLAIVTAQAATAQITGPSPRRGWEQPSPSPMDAAPADPGDGAPGERQRPRGTPAPRAARAPEKPARAPVATPGQQLDQLYGRLAKAKDEAEAQGVSKRIARLQGRSSSDTANLLMTRALTALAHDEALLAEDLLDRIVEQEPGWAEAWTRRAALRAARDDVSGAVADFGRALKIEPRHVGALSGLGFLLLRVERKDEGLRVLKAALAINPYLDPAKKVVAKLTAERGGQEL